MMTTDEVPTVGYRAVKGIRRSRGTAQSRKAPATHGIIADMIASCPETLRGIRDRAPLLLGFAGAFRRFELAALTVADLEPKPACGSLSADPEPTKQRYDREQG